MLAVVGERVGHCLAIENDEAARPELVPALLEEEVGQHRLTLYVCELGAVPSRPKGAPKWT